VKQTTRLYLKQKARRQRNAMIAKKEAAVPEIYRLPVLRWKVIMIPSSVQFIVSSFGTIDEWISRFKQTLSGDTK
jgi:hypothetical protein